MTCFVFVDKLGLHLNGYLSNGASNAWIIIVKDLLLKLKLRDLSGSPVVKTLPCHAEDTGLIPRQETKPQHALEQVSQRSTTTEAHAPLSLFAKSKVWAFSVKDPHDVVKIPCATTKTFNAVK